MAVRVPNLDIFSDKLVLRSDAGWQISDKGRQFLSALEALAGLTHDQDQLAEPDLAIAVPKPVQPALRLVVDNTRGSKPNRGPDETRRSA